MPAGHGWRKMRCINEAGHARGDRNPSASVNPTTGRYTCFACGLSGDAYDLLMQLEGIDFLKARATLGGVASPREEETWL
jgi:DNA primase